MADSRIVRITHVFFFVHMICTNDKHTDPLIKMTPFSVFVSLLVSMILPDSGSRAPIGDGENVNTKMYIT